MKSGFASKRACTAVKNNLLIFAGDDEVKIAHKLYGRAAQITKSENGFLLLSDKRSQNEQYMLLSSIIAGVDTGKCMSGKLLKNELQSILEANKALFGKIEPTGEHILQPKEYIDEIVKYAKDVSYVFIELLHSDDNMRKNLLLRLKEIQPDTGARIEVGTIGKIEVDGYVTIDVV